MLIVGRRVHIFIIMSLSGWNKVVERNGNVYYHNKFTGVVRFSPPPAAPDNVPLKRSTKMSEFTKVRDVEGRLQRGYHIGDGHYISTKRFEGEKYITFGKYEKTSNGKEPVHSSTPSIALDEDMWDELCKNKNIVTEIASQYKVSINDGTEDGWRTFPEKFRLAIGKGVYVRIIVQHEQLKVDVRRYGFTANRVFDDEENQLYDPVLSPVIVKNNENETCELGLMPLSVGTALSLEQWKRMTSLESLVAAEHLKALINQPVCPRKRPQPSTKDGLAKRRKVNLKLKLQLEPEEKQKEVDEKPEKEKDATTDDKE